MGKYFSGTFQNVVVVKSIDNAQKCCEVKKVQKKKTFYFLNILKESITLSMFNLIWHKKSSEEYIFL